MTTNHPLFYLFQMWLSHIHKLILLNSVFDLPNLIFQFCLFIHLKPLPTMILISNSTKLIIKLFLLPQMNKVLLHLFIIYILFSVHMCVIYISALRYIVRTGNEMRDIFRILTLPWNMIKQINFTCDRIWRFQCAWAKFLWVFFWEFCRISHLIHQNQSYNLDFSLKVVKYIIFTYFELKY